MAVVDYFLKIQGIDGEAQDKTHKGDLHIESFSWGETNAGTAAAGGGYGAGKVNMQDFHFVKKVDKSSPKLMLACATGEHIAKATLVCRKAGKEQQEYLKCTFSDLLISSFQLGGTEVMPTEQISFNFGKIEMEYKEQKADGTLSGAVKSGYDVKAQASS